MQEKVNILGLEFDNRTKQDIIDILYNKMKKQKKTFIVTANPEIVMHAVQDEAYMSTVRSADHVIADGIGIIIGAKILNNPLPERIPGYDLMRDLLKIANSDKLNVFFLGSREEVIEQTVKNVRKEYPNIHISGYHHGFFQENDNRIRDMVKQANPDLVFVALGFPRQEQWIKANYHSFNKGIFMGVGGSFEVIAGTAKRAPKIWRKLNIEWLYRLMKQPSRWRRMLALPKFVLKVWQNKR